MHTDEAEDDVLGWRQRGTTGRPDGDDALRMPTTTSMHPPDADNEMQGGCAVAGGKEKRGYQEKTERQEEITRQAREG